MTPKTKSPLITLEARAERLMEMFLEEHNVPERLHEDLLEEIILALECHDDDVELSNVRQSELYDYIEDYLLNWIGDFVDDTTPTLEDAISFGAWPELCQADQSAADFIPFLFFHIECVRRHPGRK